MGVENRVIRTEVVLNKDFCLSSLPPAQLPGATRVCDQNVGKECDRTMRDSQIPGEALQCPKKGLFRTESHSGPLGSQQSDRLPQIQNAYSGPDPEYTAKLRFHVFYRSERRVLLSQYSS